jgi:5'-nucleotidase
MLRRITPIAVLFAALVGAAPAAAAPLHVLVTNDDGVRAPGIDAIVQALRAEPGVTLSVVAPKTNQSGTGGSVTKGPVAASPTTTRSGFPAIAVAGTPADSVNYALHTALVGDEPQLVVSGINNGANLGPVVNFSGTVGAARAAARFGIPALATSQGTGKPLSFADSVAATVAWVRANRDSLVPGTVENLNTPACRYGGHALGTLNVPSAHQLELDALLAISGPSVCHATGTKPRDDVRAFRQGFAALSPLTL